MDRTPPVTDRTIPHTDRTHYKKEDPTDVIESPLRQTGTELVQHRGKLSVRKDLFANRLKLVSGRTGSDSVGMDLNREPTDFLRGMVDLPIQAF